MRCPQCGFENVNASGYCEQCGAALNMREIALEQEEYKAPPPPPLNGHHVLPSVPLLPSSLEYNQETPPTFPSTQGIARPGIGIFSGVLYFIGIVITIFGLLGILTTFVTGTIVGLAGFLLTLILVIVSIVFLFRIRKRVTSLRWWQRIVWIIGATLVAFLALILEAIVYPSGTLTNYFTGSILLLLGLVIAGISIR
jgi:hypothetical protein